MLMSAMRKLYCPVAKTQDKAAGYIEIYFAFCILKSFRNTTMQSTSAYPAKYSSCLGVSYNSKNEMTDNYGQRSRRRALTQDQLAQKVPEILHYRSPSSHSYVGRSYVDFVNAWSLYSQVSPLHDLFVQIRFARGICQFCPNTFCTSHLSAILQRKHSFWIFTLKWSMSCSWLFHL